MPPVSTAHCITASASANVEVVGWSWAISAGAGGSAAWARDCATGTARTADHGDCRFSLAAAPLSWLGFLNQYVLVFRWLRFGCGGSADAGVVSSVLPVNWRHSLGHSRGWRGLHENTNADLVNS